MSTYGPRYVAAAGGSLLVGKGRTLLLGAPNASSKQLLSTARVSHSQAAQASDRKAALAEVRKLFSRSYVFMLWICTFLRFLNQASHTSQSHDRCMQQCCFT